MADDAIHYVMTCPGEEFLDFPEYIFRVDTYFHVSLPEEQVVEELNALLRQDNLPYHVTNFVKEAGREVWRGQEHDVIKDIGPRKSSCGRVRPFTRRQSSQSCTAATARVQQRQR
jgi:hypothetical protein